MFTGIVQELGTVEALEQGEGGARLRIAAALCDDLREGDSVAVSGACLTAAAVDGAAFEADVMNQTLGLTTLGALAAGDRVNLEPALRAGEPLGGHIVQGHVDAVGEVAGRARTASRAGSGSPSPRPRALSGRARLGHRRRRQPHRRGARGATASRSR